MKKYVRKVLSIVLMILMINILVLPEFINVSAESTTIVQFSDANMEAAIRSLIRKPAGDIYLSDVSVITSLNLSGRNISNINGIQYLTNLTNLTLDSNPLKDVSPLRSLTKLNYISLSNIDALSGISPLGNLTNLKYLYINNTRTLSDISPLKNLRNLSELSLRDNDISDINVLSNLTNLVTLVLSRNRKLSNITPLSNLSKLVNLHLDGIHITNVSALIKLVNLELLNLNNDLWDSTTRISDISPLSGLLNLKSLQLSYNNITDITPVANMHNLNWLELRSNRITDISPVKSLTSLEFLFLGSNRISDVNALRLLNKLSTLDLSSNNLRDINALRTLNNLSYLYLGSNSLRDITIIKDLTKLNTLILDDNKITSIDPLSYCTNLTNLGLAYNNLHEDSLNAITGLAKLETLNLDFNPIRSIEVLRKSAYLTNLDGFTFYGLTSNINDRRFDIAEEKVRHILGDFIKPDMTDIEKELAIHDYVLNNTQYQSGSLQSGFYGVLVDGGGDCADYSTVMISLLNMAGVETKYIGGFGHGWNLVNLDGKYYHLDATWNDYYDSYSYDYFNLSDSQIKALRWGDMFDPAIEKAGIPCTSTEYDFLRDMLKSYSQNRNSICLSGEWIYYSDTYDGKSLYKVLLNGTNKEKLSSDKAANIQVNDGWVYYLNQSDNRLCKVMTDGTQRQLVTEPTVISSDPGRNASNVPINKRINIAFDKNVSLDKSVNPIALKDYSGRVIGVTASITNNILSIVPSQKMKGREEYTLNIPKEAIKDTGGNNLLQDYQLHFTTEKYTDVPLSVVSVSPASGSKNVPVDIKTIKIKFNRDIRMMISGNPSITFKDSNGNPVPSDSLSVGADGDMLTINLSWPLYHNMTYNLVIHSKSIVDLEDNPLPQDIRISFTTVKEKYTVAFNSNGGSKVANQLVEYNGIAVKPVDPIKSGCIFSGWYKEASCTNPWNFNTDMVKANTTLYAKWIAKPSVPSGVKAVSAGYNSIKISWSPVIGSSGYEIYSAASSSGTYSRVSTTTSTSYINLWLTTGKTYYYKIRSYRTVGTTKIYSEYSSIASTKPIPSTPTAIKAASPAYNNIKVSWAAVRGANGYELYRSNSSTGKYSLIKSTTSLSYTNSSLTTGTKYYYKVRAYRTVGLAKVYSGYSLIVSTKPIPSVPANFRITRVSSTSAKITWGRVSGASGYEIYRSASSTGTYSLIKTTTALYYSNTRLTKGKTYYYKMRAYRMVGKTKVYSNWTAVKSLKP